MVPTLASVVAKIEAAKTVEEQTELLKKNSSAALKAVVGFALDPNFKWLLPPDTPPYRPLQKSTDQEGIMYKEYKILKYFVNTPDGNQVKRVRREQMFIQLLESVDPDDALLLLRVKEKKLTIMIAAVKLAFPGISKNW